MRFEGWKSFTGAHEVRVSFCDERVVVYFGCWFHDCYNHDHDHRGDKSSTCPESDSDREGERPSKFSDRCHRVTSNEPWLTYPAIFDAISGSRHT